MALPSGQISLSQVNAELNLSPTAVITMNDAAVRTLAGVGGSGTVISMQNLQGKSNRVAIPLTISTNSYNYDVYTNRGPTYVAGTSDITVTINPGVVVGSTSTGTYAFLVPSAFNPGDTVTVVNNGVIQGRGGNGGSGGTADIGNPGIIQGNPGSNGGNAVYVNRPTTITNNGTLAGGGGGGGGGGGAVYPYTYDPETTPAYQNAGGGGGGGGAGRDGGSGGAGGGASGGSPGSANNVPGNAGSSGTSPAGGAGGPPVSTNPAATPYPSPVVATGGAGGTGGGRGASGSTGGTGSQGNPGRPGGSPGAYIVGNPFVTYPATGTRQGPSS